MSTKTNVAEEAQSAKRIRRGVSNQTQAVAQLKFHEKDAAQNGLFIGHLEEVRVDWSKNEENKDFPGISLPRLTLHFASNHTNVPEKRHVYQTLFPIPSNVDTIVDGKEAWRVDTVFNWIKHMLDAFYLKGREMTPVEEEALSLPFDDMDENGDYIPVDPEVVVNGYRTIFENAAAMLNGEFGTEEQEATGRPCYKTSDGKFISVWMKLLRHKKRKGEWFNVTANGELGFDSFIGNGVIEIFKKGVNPTILNLDLSKESITPKETKKTPTIGGPAAVGMPGAVMVDTSMGAAINPSAYSDTVNDMPF